MSIYKYLHEDRVEDILSDNLIRFTQPKYFNDPFEIKPIIHGLANKKYINENFLTDEHWNQILIQEYYKSADLYTRIPFNEYMSFATKQLPTMKTKFEEVVKSKELVTMLNKTHYNAFNESIGILSLTTKNDNLLMWAHYANSHKGFVVEFDKNHIYFNQVKDEQNFFGSLQKVKYTQIRPMSHLVEMDINEVYLTKSMEWEYEDEYRVFSSLKDADKNIVVNEEEIYLYKIRIESIKSIYCGANMTQENRNKIIGIVKDKNIQVYEMLISQKYFKLEFKLIT